jgi:hypothetical protein
MTADRDTARIVRSWLRTDEHESAEGILADALAIVATTPQRRSLGPARRIADVNTVAKFAISVAAVLAVVMAGVAITSPATFFRPGIVLPSPSPTPLATSSPTPTPIVTPDANGDIWRTGIYGPGMHEAKFGGIPFSFLIPSNGWSSYAWTGMIEKGAFPQANYAWIGFNWGGKSVNDVDPCNKKSSGKSYPTIEDIAQAYTTIPGTDAVGPTDDTLGGRPAKLVILTLHDDIPCLPNMFTFDDALTWPNARTSEVSFWFTEVDGKRFSLHVDRTAPNPRLQQEIQLIIDSIVFE